MTKIQARQLAYSIVRGVVRNFVDDGMVRRELASQIEEQGHARDAEIERLRNSLRDACNLIAALATAIDVVAGEVYEEEGVPHRLIHDAEVFLKTIRQMKGGE